MAQKSQTEQGANGRSDGFIAGVRAAASTLMNRTRFGGGGRYTFGGDRDLSKALGYAEDLSVADYRARYERGGIAERIVESYPRATWGGGADVVEDPDPGVDTDFEDAVRSLDKRHRLWTKLLRADILAGLGRYSVILIGAPGDLATEIPSLSGPVGVLYLTPLPEDRAEISEVETDPTSERFGLPLLYVLELGADATRKVHWSRVVHVAEGLLEDEVYGKPRLRAVWNYLDDLVKVVGGGSEASWNRADPGMQLDIDPTIDIDKDEEKAIEAQLEEYRHHLRKIIQTRGAKVNLLSAAVSGFGPNKAAILDLISGTTGIPHRILTGSERGELASSQDRNNWNDRVSERRQEFAEPTARDLIDRLIKAGALPKPAKPYDVRWPEEDELDETEKAKVVDMVASANKAQAESEGTVIFTADEIRDRLYGMAALSDVLDDVEIAAIRSQARALAEGRAARDESPERLAKERAVDSNLGRVMGILLTAWASAASAVDADVLERALSVRSTALAQAVVTDAVESTRLELTEKVREALLDTTADAAENTLRVYRAWGDWFDPRLRSASGSAEGRAAQIGASFDRTNPRATAFAEREAARLVTEVSAGTVYALRGMVAEAARTGVPPRQLALEIRQSVGLRSDQIAATRNLEAALREARPGTMVTRFPPAPTLRKAPGFRVRIPEGGLTEAALQRRLDQYRQMQLNLRARTIARTETARAANEGQRELWRQGQDSGELPKDVKRTWITAGDSAVRDHHADLEGEVVGIDEPFPGGIEPGEEPNCRCGQGLVRPGRASGA